MMFKKTYPYQVLRGTLAVLSLLSATGCDKLVDRSHASSSITQRAFQDATSYWDDVFTYHPPAPPQSPQTRYCYRMMSDIVCYDSLQPSLTAKLVGYQDNASVSWVQPGGGSLGASGGDPVSYAPSSRPTPKTEVIEMKTPVESVAVETVNDRQGEIRTTLLPAK